MGFISEKGALQNVFLEKDSYTVKDSGSKLRQEHGQSEEKGSPSTSLKIKTSGSRTPFLSIGIQ